MKVILYNIITGYTVGSVRFNRGEVIKVFSAPRWNETGMVSNSKLISSETKYRII